MDRNTFQELVDKYQQGTCSDEERMQLLSWYNHYMKEQPSGIVPKGHGDIKQLAWAKILAELPAEDSKTKRLLPRWVAIAAAAIVLLSLTFGYLLLFQKTDRASSYSQTDFLPGGNRATLQLADGSRIALDEAQGVIVTMEDAISYDAGQGAIANLKGAQQLQLSTPKGGTYRLVLPDGSQVWLNANSTLHYPSQFNDSVRIVELVGEAYFAVAKAQHPKHKDIRLPFMVKSKGQVVEVLGTEFNVSAYADEEDSKTTLVEGSVRLSIPQDQRLAPEKSILLHPGEQAVSSNGTLRKDKVDLARFISWKDGLFYFHDADINEIMNQLERWYDVEVVYQGVKTKKQFTGEIPRDRNASEVLAMLEFFGLQYQIEGRRIILSNKL